MRRNTLASGPRPKKSWVALLVPEDAPFASLERAGDEVRAVVRPDHARALCAGHFPDDPLVPGAHLAGLMASVAVGLMGDAHLAEIERCVFLRRVGPDAPILVTARRAGPQAVEAEVASAGAIAARALLRFRIVP